jgi:hypothetical protein
MYEILDIIDNKDPKVLLRISIIGKWKVNTRSINMIISQAGLNFEDTIIKKHWKYIDSSVEYSSTTVHDCIVPSLLVFAKPSPQLIDITIEHTTAWIYVRPCSSSSKLFCALSS